MSIIYIGRLNYKVTKRDLETFFKGYGKIQNINIKSGFGLVEFDDYRDADDAVFELNGKKLLGESITLEHAKGSLRGRNSFSSPHIRGSPQGVLLDRNKLYGTQRYHHGGGRDNSRSRSRSRSYSRSQSRSRSGSRSKSRSMSKSRSRSKSHSKSRSRSQSPAKARSKCE